MWYTMIYLSYGWCLTTYINQSIWYTYMCYSMVVLSGVNPPWWFTTMACPMAPAKIVGAKITTWMQNGYINVDGYNMIMYDNVTTISYKNNFQYDSRGFIISTQYTDIHWQVAGSKLEQGKPGLFDRHSVQFPSHPPRWSWFGNLALSCWWDLEKRKGWIGPVVWYILVCVVKFNLLSLWRIIFKCDRIWQKTQNMCKIKLLRRHLSSTSRIFRVGHCRGTLVWSPAANCSKSCRRLATDRRPQAA